MNIYTYSYARQHLSKVLDKAESTGKVLIRRRDGRVFALIPDPVTQSPLDVPSIKADIPTPEVVSIIRKERAWPRKIRTECLNRWVR